MSLKLGDYVEYTDARVSQISSEMSKQRVEKWLHRRGHVTYIGADMDDGVVGCDGDLAGEHFYTWRLTKVVLTIPAEPAESELPELEDIIL